MSTCHFTVCLSLIFTYIYTTSTEPGYNKHANEWTAERSQLRKRASGNNSELCESMSCKNAASKMLLQMNHDADPCEEFYNFACGGEIVLDETALIRQNLEQILDYIKTNTNSTDKYLQNYFKFYKSCSQYNTNFNFIDRARLHSSQNLSIIDLVLNQAVPFLDIGLDIGKNQSYEFQLTLPGASTLKTTTKGWLILERLRQQCLQTFWEINGHNADLNKIYNNSKECTKNLLNDYIRSYEIHLQLLNEEHPYIKELTFLLNHFEELSPNINEIIQRRDSKKYTRTSIKDLSKKYDLINWKTLLQGITINKIFEDDDTLQVYFPEYFDKVFDFLKAFNESHIINILTEFHNFQLYVNTVLKAEQENKDYFCVEMANDLMPDIATIISYNLIRQNVMLHYWNQKTKILFDELKKILEQSLGQSSLDEYSTKVLQTKLKQITLGLITSGNSNSTKKNYNNLKISSGRYQENILTLIQNYRKIIYSLVGIRSSPATLLNYFVDPFYSRPNGFYTSQYIVFHPEMLLRINMDLPDYITLAKIGIHLAHELAKHFDPIGRQFLVDSDVSSCDGFYKQLRKQTVTLLDMQENIPDFQDWNRDLIIDSMIVDNAAFRMIVDLSDEKQDLQILPWVTQTYTKEQTFFITSIQEYCKKTSLVDYNRDLVEGGYLPSLLRIHNVVTNSHHFSSAFSCKEGSAMSLDSELITQFPYIEYIEYDDE